MSSLKNQRIVCVIPAYNEASVIAEVVHGVRSVFKKAGLTFEVVVVNDCSKDDTSRVAKNARATVIDHLINQGAGGATTTGLHYAAKTGADFGLTMDADGQHKPEDVLSCLVAAADTKTDLMIGSRLMNTQGMSTLKVLGNKGLSAITRLLFGVHVTDSQSGLRVYSQRALTTLEWKSTGYDFCSEMLWRAKQIHLSIAEHPIEAIYTDYSRAKGQNNWNAINIVRSLLRRRIVELFE